MQTPYNPEAFQTRTTACENQPVCEYDVTIGLLCYRDRDNIDGLLASLEASPHSYRYEVILSDNGSTDGTREMVRTKYPYVRILENGKNLGVAGGRNRIFWNSRAKYTMILDSDTLLHPGTVDRLVAMAEGNPKIGLIHPKLVYRDGRLQLSIRPFPRLHHIAIEGTKLRRFFEWTGLPAKIQMRNSGHDTPMPIDCCYGAAFLIRNELLPEIGGFDEGYFYQYEDYDLCYRVKAAGYENWYEPAALVTHFYEREDRVFHPGLKKHLRSIFRFLSRNIWKLSKAPVVHTQAYDRSVMPQFKAPIQFN